MDEDADFREWLEDEFGWKDERRILRFRDEGDVTYVAVEDVASGKTSAYVVFHFEGTQSKDYPESAGPSACTCPADILAILTPTSNEEALKWRENCRINLLWGEAFDLMWSKIEPGDVIEFDTEFFGETSTSRLGVIDASTWDLDCSRCGRPFSRAILLEAFAKGKLRVIRDGKELSMNSPG